MLIACDLSPSGTPARQIRVFLAGPGTPVRQLPWLSHPSSPLALITRGTLAEK